MHEKELLISRIKKNTEQILNLWNEAKFNYDYVKARENHLTFAGKELNRMKQSIDLIWNIALNDYEQPNRVLNRKIARTFEDFNDFLYWYLNELSINPKEWNEIEEYYDKRTKQKHQT